MESMADIMDYRKSVLELQGVAYEAQRKTVEDNQKDADRFVQKLDDNVDRQITATYSGIDDEDRAQMKQRLVNRGRQHNAGYDKIVRGAFPNTNPAVRNMYKSFLNMVYEMSSRENSDFDNVTPSQLFAMGEDIGSDWNPFSYGNDEFQDMMKAYGMNRQLVDGLRGSARARWAEQKVDQSTGANDAALTNSEIYDKAKEAGLFNE